MIDTTMQKSAYLFDLNQNARGFRGKYASFHSSAPVFDFNSKERAKKATKRSASLFLDLNRIKTEEEEFLGNESLSMEEPQRSILRSLVDEQQNDINCQFVGTLETDRIGQGRRRFHGKIRWR